MTYGLLFCEEYFLTNKDYFSGQKKTKRRGKEEFVLHPNPKIHVFKKDPMFEEKYVYY